MRRSMAGRRTILVRDAFLSGGRMVEHLMEGLVLDVVMDVITDAGIPNHERAEITLASDFSDLGVDQLTMTYIVLSLEDRLGIEVPSDLEDARTVGDLVAGIQDALRSRVTSLHSLPRTSESLPTRIGHRSVGRHRVYYGKEPWHSRRVSA
jgi:acyl carrier protein